MTLKQNGFELLDSPVADAGSPVNFYNNGDILNRYYPDVSKAMKLATGATHVFPFDHNVRSAGLPSAWNTEDVKKDGKGPDRIEGGQKVQSAIHLVHGDYTLVSAPLRARQLAKPPGSNDTLKSVLGNTPLVPVELVDRCLGEGGRFMLVNLWRNIADAPVQCHPLGLCDAQTVLPEDLVTLCATPSGPARTTLYAKQTAAKSGISSTAWSTPRRC